MSFPRDRGFLKSLDCEVLGVYQGFFFALFSKHPLFKIWMPGQRISTIGRARFVEDDEGVVGQEEGPAGLATVQPLLRRKIEEVNMIRPDFKDICATLKIMAEGSKSTDNGKEFFIMNSVITLCRLEGLGKVSNRVPTIEKVRLF